MSIKLMTAVWDCPDQEVKNSRKLVLLCFADHANDEGLCYPSTPRVAARSNLSERQAQRTIDWLIDAGYLTIEAEPSGHRRTLYKVHANGDGKAQPRGDKLSPQPPTTTPKHRGRGDNLSPQDGTPRGDISSTRGDNLSDRGDISSNAYIEEPSVESPIIDPPEKGIGGAAPPAPADDDNGAWLALLETLCNVSHGHRDIGMLTEVQQIAVRGEAKRIRDAGYGAQDVTVWFGRHWQTGWQWKKGQQRPTPTHVRTGLPALKESRYAVTADVPGPAPMPAIAPTLPAPERAQDAPISDDPWSRCMADFRRTLPMTAMGFLAGSTLTALDGEGADGEALFRVTIQRREGVDWLINRCGGAIARALRVTYKMPVNVEIIAAAD